MKMIRNDNKSSPFVTDKSYYNDKLKMIFLVPPYK